MPGPGVVRHSSSSARRFSFSSRYARTDEVDVRAVEAAHDDLGSRMPNRSTISARTGGAAVAVSASTGGWPSDSITPPRRR